MPRVDAWTHEEMILVLNQARYFSMKGNDWRHLIRDYVRKVTERPDLQEEEVFRYVMAG